MNVLDTAQNICDQFAALGDWIGVCTGPPGNTRSVFNEAAGGDPAYSRQATNWTEHTNGSATGSTVILNLPPGTYPYMIVCQSEQGQDMVDWCVLPTPIIVSRQQAVQITPSIVFN